MQLKNKILLEYDYDSGSPVIDNSLYRNTTHNTYSYNNICSTNNFTLQNLNPLEYIKYQHHPTEITTDIIPNIISKTSFDKINPNHDPNPEENELLLDLIENILYVLVPIVTIILVVIIIIQCKKLKARSQRIQNYSLSHLKQTTSIKYMKVDSDESVVINSLV